MKLTSYSMEGHTNHPDIHYVSIQIMMLIEKQRLLKRKIVSKAVMFYKMFSNQNTQPNSQ